MTKVYQIPVIFKNTNFEKRSPIQGNKARAKLPSTKHLRSANEVISNNVGRDKSFGLIRIKDQYLHPLNQYRGGRLSQVR